VHVEEQLRVVLPRERGHARHGQLRERRAWVEAVEVSQLVGGALQQPRRDDVGAWHDDQAAARELDIGG
jgi:hypothetical protein